MPTSPLASVTPNTSLSNHISTRYESLEFADMASSYRRLLLFRHQIVARKSFTYSRHCPPLLFCCIYFSWINVFSTHSSFTHPSTSLGSHQLLDLSPLAMQVSDQVKLNSRNLYFKCLSCFNIVFISGSSRKYNVVTGFNKKKRGIKLDSEAYILKCFLVLLRNIWIRMEQVEIRFCTLHMDDNNYTRRCCHFCLGMNLI